MPKGSNSFADDLLRGADEIAEFLLGDCTRRRVIYHWAATSRLPVFRLGSMLCARRSVLLQWIATQEGWPPPTPGASAIPAPSSAVCDDQFETFRNASNR